VALVATYLNKVLEDVMIQFIRKIKYSALLLLSLCLSVFMYPTHAKPLIMVSDEWCPYVCEDDELPGFLIEIINEIALNNNIKIELSLMPLARALDLTQKGEVDIALALTSQHVTDFKLLKTSSSFGGLYNDFYVKKGQSWHFQGMADLGSKLADNTILGIINGYEYGKDIAQLIETHPEHVFPASGTNPLKNQLKMLQMGRLDILLDSRFTVQYQLSKLPNSTIVYAGTQGDFTPLFLGFSPSLNKKLIPLFDQGLQTLRQNGRLSKILMKYGVQDWQEKNLTQHNNAHISE
jgi:polar amino acid transport system substrate-binding protein